MAPAALGPAVVKPRFTTPGAAALQAAVEAAEGPEGFAGATVAHPWPLPPWARRW